MIYTILNKPQTPIMSVIPLTKLYIPWEQESRHKCLLTPHNAKVLGQQQMYLQIDW